MVLRKREDARAVHPPTLSHKCLLENTFGSQIGKGCDCRKVIYLSRWWLLQQPSCVAWEVNKIPSAHATVASGKDSWENEQLAPWGVACGLHLGAGGHQKLGKEAALCKAEFRVAELALQRL